MMHPVSEWVEKAEGDFATAEREYRARKNPNHDAVCFHAQQCIEKYMKGALVKVGIAYSKTHDLNYLLDLIVPHEPMLEAYRDVLEVVTQYAASFRYPGDSADREMAREALLICRRIRKDLRESLKLK